MNLKEIVEEFSMKVLSGSEKLDNNIKGGYVSDLLSDVMANTKEGDIWITQQTHQNVVAVASLKELAGIVIVGDRMPDDETLAKAKEQSVPMLRCPLPAFEVVGRLFSSGVSGTR